MKTKHVPFIPIMANENFLEGNKGNMEETRERIRLGKSPDESQIERHFLNFSREINYFRDIGNIYYPSKIKLNNYYNYKTNPEIYKKNQ
jgi:hypothetical protein